MASRVCSRPKTHSGRTQLRPRRGTPAVLHMRAADSFSGGGGCTRNEAQTQDPEGQGLGKWAEDKDQNTLRLSAPLALDPSRAPESGFFICQRSSAARSKAPPLRLTERKAVPDTAQEAQDPA